MVTNTQFAPALCKCLIYGLDAYFPIDMIYSSAKVHKQRCFESIIAKFRRGSASQGGDEDSDSEEDDVEFIAIGDGAEEEAVSHALGIKFYKIRTYPALAKLLDPPTVIFNLQAMSVNPAAVVLPAALAAGCVPAFPGAVGISTCPSELLAGELIGHLRATLAPSLLPGVAPQFHYINVPMQNL
ncbi:hypothetical protein P43SY_010073 [Pythium insidiosum]|uniref:protein-tyrosine-phosphatase n=1 Tax=Pythium insidiosum TaxID=114742 RepID=A0AAD5QD43_PYTIN|nr:hypothetical protein P43SY_010073 [Pythium insidiosum]